MALAASPRALLVPVQVQALGQAQDTWGDRTEDRDKGLTMNLDKCSGAEREGRPYQGRGGDLSRCVPLTD